MAQAGLTVRRTCQADAKAEHSEPMVRVRCGQRLTDKSYPGDNRLVPPKSSYRRRCSAPRCRLTLSWRRRSFQGFGCSPIKKVRELGSDRSGWKKNSLQTIFLFWTVWIQVLKTTHNQVFSSLKFRFWVIKIGISIYSSNIENRTNQSRRLNI